MSTGSGNHGPMYVSRRARADCASLIASRVVVVARNAAGSRTAARSVPCQRSHASCTISSASCRVPSIRYAIPNSRGRTASKVSMSAAVMLTPRSYEATPAGTHSASISACAFARLWSASGISSLIAGVECASVSSAVMKRGSRPVSPTPCGSHVSAWSRPSRGVPAP